MSLHDLNLLQPDLSALCEAWEESGRELLDVFEISREPADDTQNPPLLVAALDQLASVVRCLEQDYRRRDLPHDIDLGELLDFGLNLLEHLRDWAERLKRIDLRLEFELYTIPFALWTIRRGGELRTLDVLVDGLAYLANKAQEPAYLSELCTAMGELLVAVSPLVRSDLETGNPERPWRLLNINCAIVATRTHNPAVMDAAFRTLIENIPDEAAEFFREGMVQMDALDYPLEIRQVMERHYRAWCAPRTMH